MSNSNTILNTGRELKNDEFYTLPETVEEELSKYPGLLRGARVLCNCNDIGGGFEEYLWKHFTELGLTELVVVGYVPGGHGLVRRYHSDGVSWETLDGSGSFSSPECISLLLECDIVITNPPFSEFRRFIDIVSASGKKFLVIGNSNAHTYDNVAALVTTGKLWTGQTNFNLGMMFRIPNWYPKYHHIDADGNKIARVASTCWWTNIDYPGRHTHLCLTKKYADGNYRKIDGTDIIECQSFRDIPCDWEGDIAVPITFIGHWCPDQFIIKKVITPFIDGHKIYKRLVICRK